MAAVGEDCGLIEDEDPFPEPLDDVMSRLEATDQAVCASFFDRLVTLTGGKVAA